MALVRRSLVGAALFGLGFGSLLSFMAADKAHSGRTAREVRMQAPLDRAMFPSFFRNKDGLHIFYRVWRPKDMSKCIGFCVICHGFGEHIGRYEHVAAALVRLGFVVYGLDHQGHGRSEGDRGYFASFPSLVDDIIHLCGFALKDLPDAQNRFLIGHSMGGLLAAHVTMKTDNAMWNGVILSAPLMMLDPAKATPFKKAVVKKLSNILPKLKIDSVPTNLISTDESVVASYELDSLIYHEGTSLQVAHQLLLAMDHAMQQAHTSFKSPLLWLHGKDDKLCLPEGGRMFYNKVGTLAKSKNMKLFDGMLHEIFNERGRDEFGCNSAVDYMVQWISNKMHPLSREEIAGL